MEDITKVIKWLQINSNISQLETAYQDDKIIHTFSASISSKEVSGKLPKHMYSLRMSNMTFCNMWCILFGKFFNPMYSSIHGPYKNNPRGTPNNLYGHCRKLYSYELISFFQDYYNLVKFVDKYDDNTIFLDLHDYSKETKNREKRIVYDWILDKYHKSEEFPGFNLVFLDNIFWR